MKFKINWPVLILTVVYVFMMYPVVMAEENPIRYVMYTAIAGFLGYYSFKAKKVLS